jgi:hypothetical protein
MDELVKSGSTQFPASVFGVSVMSHKYKPRSQAVKCYDSLSRGL